MKLNMLLNMLLNWLLNLPINVRHATHSGPTRLLILTLLLFVVSLSAVAGEPDPRQLQRFESKIRPALIEHCLECHSMATEASGGLVLDSRQGWQRGGDLGPAIVPGDADASRLIQAIRYDNPDLQMPPQGKLDAETIAALVDWVQSGAIDPRELNSDPNSDPSGQTDRAGSASRVARTALTVERAHEHWAYRPVVAPGRMSMDAIEASDTAIDVLIDQRITEAGLTAADAAQRQVIVRRLSFDLHGLPPTPQTVEAFLCDRSENAYENLVDRMLASPHYAEHFARHWMDVVRYAESITLRGFVLPEAWRYRDYLIEAYATDRPFDQMIRDHIAGDLLASDDLHETQLRAIATGFLAMGNTNLEDQDKTKLEFDHLDEQLETIGRAFLGQTIGCARCHDHKFDPIPTRDYYALAAIMKSTTPLKHANLSKWIEHPLPLEPADAMKFDALQSEIDAATAELAALGRVQKAKPDTLQRSIPIDTLDGVVVDDAHATLTGMWTESTFVKPFVGQGYRHDDSAGQGTKSATFDPPELATGLYEVRMSYTAHENRATKVRVDIFSANDSTTVFVNQRQRPNIDGVWFSLGVYPFERQGQSFVIVSNEDADGCVIIDAIQFRAVGENDTNAPVQGMPTAAVINGNPTNDNPTTSDKAVAEPDNDRRRKLESQLKTWQAALAARPHYLTIAESEPVDQLAIRIRGNVHQPGEWVRRGFLSAIGPAEQYAAQINDQSSGRVQLADWIADPRHPLTARVYANRVWSWLMGEGLVATENHFGTTGEPVSHPELLDLLAHRLIQEGWSTKWLVRMIVTSDAYRRSVVDDPQRTTLDPNNRLYSSANVKRIPVEALRDAMLVVSGELDREVGGSTIRAGTTSDYEYDHDLLRRSVYLPVFRNSLPTLFESFDFADASVSVGQRSRSTVATQSLVMMNHPWIITRAQNCADKMLKEHPGQPAVVIVDRLYRECFSRPPSAEEQALCLRFLGGDRPSQDRIADLVQSLFASIDFRYLE